MEGSYLLAKKIVEYKYPDDYKYKSFLIVALYAFLNKYKGYEELVCDTFLKTRICIEKMDVGHILYKYGYQDEKKNESSIYIRVKGITDYGRILRHYKSDGFVCCRRRPIIACDSRFVSNTLLLNYFCHEFNHLIKSQINDLFISNNVHDYMNIRCGISHTTYKHNKDSNKIKIIHSGRTFEEVLNVLQTTDIIKDVKTLKDFVCDKEVILFLDSLSDKKLRKHIGYEGVVSVVCDLWECDNFREIYENNVIEGNTDIVIKSFDNIVGDNSFDYLSELLDKIDYSMSSCLFSMYKKRFIKEANAIVNNYLSASKNKEYILTNNNF